VTAENNAIGSRYQLETQVLLQRSDFPAHARLTQLESARCRRERDALRNLNKDSKFFQAMQPSRMNGVWISLIGWSAC
jgi:hypothetical protein